MMTISIQPNGIAQAGAFSNERQTRYLESDTAPGLYVDGDGNYRWVKRYRGELLMFELDGRGMGNPFTPKHARFKRLALGTWLGEAEFFLDDTDGVRRPSELQAEGQACGCLTENCWFGQIGGRNFKLCSHYATLIAWDLRVYRWELECAEGRFLWTSRPVRPKAQVANDDDESAERLTKFCEIVARINDSGTAWAYFSREGNLRRLWQHVFAGKGLEVELCANDVEPHSHDWPGLVRIKLLELWSDERREWLDNYCSCTTFLTLSDMQTGEALGRCCKHWLRMNNCDAAATWALVSLDDDMVWASEIVPPGPDCALF